MKPVLLIPVYNYANFLPETLEKILQWQSKTKQQFQVCVIDDGSKDATPEILDNFCAEHKEWFHFLRLPANQGKGAALKKGFQLYLQKSDYIFFTDCDLHYGLSIIQERMLPALEKNDIVIADRSWVASSNHEAISRRLSSYIFNRLMGQFTGVTLRDSQAGCKGFRSQVCAPIFDLMKTKGFAFDVEILSIAMFYRMKIMQIPVRFIREHQFPEESSIKLIRSSLQMIFDLLRINLRWKRGYYKSDALEKRIDDQVYTIPSEQ